MINKLINRIIAISMAISVFSMIEPVKYSITTKDAHASDYVSVYLKNLSLNKSDIDFSEDIFFYNVKVDQDVDSIRITAKPKSDDASVSINGNFIDENDSYRETVNLERGNNTVKVKVTNDTEYKIYTLNIVRGEAEQDKVYLDNISLNNVNINFLKEVDNYNINVKEAVSKITLTAIPEQDTYEVTVDGIKVNKGNNYKQDIDLNKGKNPIVIRVKNKKNEQRIYTLNITRENGLDINDRQDDIYLEYLKLDNKTINIYKNKNIYDLNFDKNTSLIEIKAEPESIDYKVKINNKIVEEIDNYKDSVKLVPGKNQIKIELQDEKNSKQRTYTLNINVGTIPDTSGSNAETSFNNSIKDNRYNQWIQINNKWQYNDSVGQPLKNTWFYDKNIVNKYYLQADGTMAIGWLNNNGYWYYLGQNGAMQTGWQLINGQWYYLNSEGIMKTGWFLDLNKKYYYLQENGVMAKSTTIDGYKLGKDGAWIK